MFSEVNNDALACIIKSNPDFESAIQTIIDDNKKTTSMFVHELRNPLALLKGTVQFIEQKHPETKDYKYWDQLQDLLNDMEHIMADASQLNICNYIHKDYTDLLSLTQNVIDSFMPQALTQMVTLSLTVNPGCDKYFENYACDTVKIKQVLSNLVKNALEATTEGDYIQVNLDYLEGASPTPSKLLIQVGNSGSPIPEDELTNIFTPFVTYKKGGTGIGLALVKRVIDLHYGSICVESDETFTSFTISLPL